MSKMLFKAMEYVGFLGDPASAIWGAFSELAEDWWLSTEARRKKFLKRELLVTVILGGQTEFKEETERKMTNAIILRVLLDMLSHHTIDQDAIDAMKSGDIDKPGSSATDVASTGILRRRLRIALEKEKETITEIPPLAATDDNINRITKALINTVEDENVKDGVELEKALAVLKAQIKRKNPITKKDKSDEESTIADPTEVQQLKDAIEKILEDTTLATHSKLDHIPRALLREGTFAHRLWDGVRMNLESRLDFVNTILVPIVLLLVVTASVFYDAYQNLGDNATAHSLAFGILYSWIIILAVAGNCFTSTSSTGVIRRTIADILPLSDTTVRLSERYVNSLRWRFWLVKVGIVADHPTEPTKGGKIRFLLGQLFGWICVAIASSCAAAISYTTPTVGIGCRSFTFLLYALVSLFIAVIPPLIYWREGVGKRKRFGAIMIWTKRGLMFCNILIILGGTLFHLIGLFRSCFCMNLFRKDDHILQLNQNTKQAVDNANTYWLSVGYVAFIFIWLVCSAAIIMRQYISLNVGLLQGMNVDDDEYGIRSTAIQTYERHYEAAKRRLERKLPDKLTAPKAADPKAADPKAADPKAADPNTADPKADDPIEPVRNSINRPLET
jgi:hypothetical protein